jgi:poly-gamma-glutamate synthesis protein (capsule biosynthesis protein)
MVQRTSGQKIVVATLTTGFVVMFVSLLYVSIESREGTLDILTELRADQVPSVVAENEIEIATTSILFVGDMNFDRYIRILTERHGSDYIFSCIDEMLEQVDLVVGNLEGPITSYKSVSKGSEVGSPQNFQFTFPTTTAELLFDHNIKLVNIGNNHIRDFGLSGLESTREYLAKAGVGYFGGVASNTSAYVTEINGNKLSFVNYNQFGGDTRDTVAELISTEKGNGNIVIVYTHWGEEYVEPTSWMKTTAELFVQSGADMIIGSHPHVIQSSEVIGDTIVYYSLGNFIFDQYWDESVRSGLAVLVHISKDGITIEEKPVTIKPYGQTCPKVEVSSSTLLTI